MKIEQMIKEWRKGCSCAGPMFDKMTNKPEGKTGPEECPECTKGLIEAIEKQCVSPDSNVEKNREMLLQRSIVGLAKYGVTTDNNPLPLRAWLQHALEEALDMANYLQAAISKLDEEGAKNDNAN